MVERPRKHLGKPLTRHASLQPLRQVSRRGPGIASPGSAQTCTLGPRPSMTSSAYAVQTCKVCPPPLCPQPPEPCAHTQTHPQAAPAWAPGPRSLIHHRGSTSLLVPKLRDQRHTQLRHVAGPGAGLWPWMCLTCFLL